MPYQVTFDDDDGIVHVRLWGRATTQEHHAARKEAINLCLERKSEKLLVDLRDFTSQDAPTMDCFEFGETLAEEIIPKKIRVAHISPKDNDAFQTLHFTLTVAKNRGAPVEEFATPEEAKKWLLS